MNFLQLNNAQFLILLYFITSLLIMQETKVRVRGLPENNILLCNYVCCYTFLSGTSEGLYLKVLSFHLMRIFVTVCFTFATQITPSLLLEV